MQLEELGFTKEELRQRVVDQCVEQLVSGMAYDEDGEPYTTPSSIYSQLRAAMQERIDEAVRQIADREVLPKISEQVESLVLQETNRWGERKGEPVTFVEYLIGRAEQYMQEKVDWDGKSKGESSNYTWRGKQTRIAYMVHRHLHVSIEQAMKEAVENANQQIAKGIQETVKIKLAEVAEKLKVSVSAGR